MKQPIASPDRLQVLNFEDEYSYVQLRTFRGVLRGPGQPGALSWSLEFDPEYPIIVRDPETRDRTLFEGRRLRYAASVAEDKLGRPLLERLSYSFASRTFALEVSDKAGRTSAHPAANHDYTLTAGSAIPPFEFRRMRGRPWDLPPPINCFGFPDELYSYYRNASFLSDLELALHRQFVSQLERSAVRRRCHREPRSSHGAQCRRFGLVESSRCARAIWRGRRFPLPRAILDENRVSHGGYQSRSDR